MKIEEARKLSPLNRFCYWIGERHRIYQRRLGGRKKPWTDDTVLQSSFFTNPYREHDKTTVWFRENIRDPLRELASVILATVIFRWFNYIPTGLSLLGNGISVPNLLLHWEQSAALRRLGAIREKGGQVFTGAFMINSPGGEKKLEAICRRIDNVWRDRERLIDFFEQNRGLGKSHGLGMEDAHDLLTRYEGLGGFMSYEIVCDLRYTVWLESAPDKMTWCHIGPGATRGLYRVLGLDFKKGDNASSPPKLKNGLEEMRKLLTIVQERLPDMPPFEMREIEHSLCELDKYERLLWGDGRAKRTYNGT